MELTKQQAKILRQLTKAEKEAGANPFTDNHQSLPELVQEAWKADEDEYWRLWKIFYLRICLLTETTNARARILDIMDAPIFLEREMNEHDYLHKYN